MAAPRPGGARDTDNLSRAVACALAGGAVLTLNDSFLKALTADMPTGQILALRSLCVYVTIAWFAHRAGGLSAMWRIGYWPGQLLRAGCVIGISFTFVTALKYHPQAFVTSIAFTGPLFVTAMAPFLLNETVGWRRWMAVLVGFIGVLMIVRPGSQVFDWIMVLPIVSAFLGALRDVVTRRMAPTETSVSVLFVTTTSVCLVGWMTWFVGDWVPVEAHHIKYILGSGILVGIAHYLVIESFRWGEAAVVSPLKYLNLLWASLFGYLLFGDVPASATILGAAVIVASGLYILHRERRRSVT